MLSRRERRWRAFSASYQPSAAYGQPNDRAVFSAGPTLCSIRKRETEQRDLRDLTLLYPGDPAIGRHQDSPHRPNHSAMLRGEKLNAVEGCARLARLINPMGPSILRM